MSKGRDFFQILIASFTFFKYICVHGFHCQSTSPILLKIDIHVRFTMMHIRKNFLKIAIGSCKFMQLAIF